MKEIKSVWFCLKIAVIVLFLASLAGCQKTDYNLLDPASAGVWTLYNTSNGLPLNTVYDIKLDTQGKLWLAFPGGGAATYMDGVFTNYKTTNSSIINNSATSLGPSSDGSMLIGTANGISEKTINDLWTSYKDPGVAVMYINTIKVSSGGTIWLGTSNQGFYKSNGTSLIRYYDPLYKNVYAIEEDVNGNIFLGTDNGILKWNGSSFSTITTANGLPKNTVTALHPDSRQRMWIGMYQSETVCWLDYTGLHNQSLMTGDVTTYVTDIFEDRRGDVWFATYGNGVVRFDGAVAYSFKEYNGFYEDYVDAIGEDKDGNLWFGLDSKGLVKYTLPLENK
jgi:ligand-binding sensor domain-containing protein